VTPRWFGAEARIVPPLTAPPSVGPATAPGKEGKVAIAPGRTHWQGGLKSSPIIFYITTQSKSIKEVLGAVVAISTPCTTPASEDLFSPSPPPNERADYQRAAATKSAIRCAFVTPKTPTCDGLIRAGTESGSLVRKQPAPGATGCTATNEAFDVDPGYPRRKPSQMRSLAEVGRAGRGIG